MKSKKGKEVIEVISLVPAEEQERFLRTLVKMRKIAPMMVALYLLALIATLVIG